jgi:hypothetical protein
MSTGDFSGSKDKSQLYAGEINKSTGAVVGPRAILNRLQERKTCQQETWWVQGQVSTLCRRDKQVDRRLGWSKGDSKLYAGETNMCACWKSNPFSSVVL